LPIKRRRLYWDSNCFIALLTKQQTIENTYLDAIETTYDDMLRGKLKIVTCADLFKLEVLPGPSKREAAAYNSLLSCPDFEIVSISLTDLVNDAAQLRQEARKKAQSIHTCDAMHIVSAKRSAVDEFWTTDDKLVKKGKAGFFEGLVVCYPYTEQLRLFL